MNADMAELADALASGASRGNSVEVQVLLSALYFKKSASRLETDFFISADNDKIR